MMHAAAAQWARLRDCRGFCQAGAPTAAVAVSVAAVEMMPLTSAALCVVRCALCACSSVVT